MVELRLGIFEEEYKFIDVTGKEQKITLKPLPSKYLPTLFKLASKFSKGKEEDSIIDILGDEDTIRMASDLCLETIKISCPSQSVEDIDAFVSSNFIDLLPSIVSFNLKKR